MMIEEKITPLICSLSGFIHSISFRATLNTKMKWNKIRNTFPGEYLLHLWGLERNHGGWFDVLHALHGSESFGYMMTPTLWWEEIFWYWEERCVWRGQDLQDNKVKKPPENQCGSTHGDKHTQWLQRDNFAPLFPFGRSMREEVERERETLLFSFHHIGMVTEQSMICTLITLNYSFTGYKYGLPWAQGLPLIPAICALPYTLHCRE